jgi:hypothetical protein
MSARTVHTPPEPFIRYGCVEFPADVILAAALAPAWVDRAVADQDPMPHVLRSGPVAWSYRPRGPAARYRWGRQRITHDRRRRTSSFRSSAQLAVGLGSAGQRRPQRVRPRSPRRPRLGVRWWTPQQPIIEVGYLLSCIASRCDAAGVSGGLRAAYWRQVVDT